MDIVGAINFLESVGIRTGFFVDSKGIIINGDFIIKNDIETIPYKMLSVKGNMVCRFNKLKTLKNFPQIIGGDFDVSHNELKNLEGGPLIVKGNYNCSNNNLISLKGAAYKVGGSFSCANNFIDTLEYLPMEIEGTLNVSDNYLVDLEGAPMYIDPEKFNYSKNFKLGKRATDDYWYDRVERDLSLFDKIRNRISPEMDRKIKDELFSTSNDMIKNFSDFNVRDMKKVIIIETGEIIEISKSVFNYSSNLRLIKYSDKYKCYICSEDDLDIIKSIK